MTNEQPGHLARSECRIYPALCHNHSLLFTLTSSSPSKTGAYFFVTDMSCLIIGGGIVGLATAYRLLERFPAAKVTLLEKEARVGAHQSTHNSGVLHAGIS